MNADLKRLCEAVLHAQGIKDRGYCWALMTEGGALAVEAEAIVRAVLVALQEPSEGLIAAGSVDFLRDVTDPWDCMSPEMDEVFGFAPDALDSWAPAEERIRPKVRRAAVAMIDYVLSSEA